MNGYGRPRDVDIRAVVDAIFYLLKMGCQWPAIPHDYPPWGTVHWYWAQCRDSGLWQELNDVLRRDLRSAAGRHDEPSAAVIDSQSLKSAEKRGARGYDAGKKVVGRKRHILVDMTGLLLAVHITPASVQDRDGAQLLLSAVRDRLPRLTTIFADGGYAGQLIA